MFLTLCSFLCFFPMALITGLTDYPDSSSPTNRRKRRAAIRGEDKSQTQRMTKTIVGLAILVGAASGCSSTVVLTSPVEANRRIGAYEGTVRLRSGVEYEVRQIHVFADSTGFVDCSNDSTLHMPNRSIESIRICHHGGGAIEGLLFGGLGGTAAGLTLGIGLSSNGDEGTGKGLLALTGLAIGSAGGLALGGIKGHDYALVFPQDSSGRCNQTP